MPRMSSGTHRGSLNHAASPDSPEDLWTRRRSVALNLHPGRRESIVEWKTCVFVHTMPLFLSCWAALGCSGGHLPAFCLRLQLFEFQTPQERARRPPSACPCGTAQSPKGPEKCYQPTSRLSSELSPSESQELRSRWLNPAFPPERKRP